MQIPSLANNFQESHADLLMSSFRQITGRPLVAPATAEALYTAPFAVLSHCTAADPILTYGNLFAQSVFEMPWGKLVTTESRLTAESMHRKERESMFEKMRNVGWIGNYRGVRISTTGQRFEIRNATIWPLVDASGLKRGEAAMFSEYVLV